MYLAPTLQERYVISQSNHEWYTPGGTVDPGEQPGQRSLVSCSTKRGARLLSGRWLGILYRERHDGDALALDYHDPSLGSVWSEPGHRVDLRDN